MGQNIVIPNLGDRAVRSPLRLDAHGSVESTFVHDEMHYRDPVDAGPESEARYNSSREPVRASSSISSLAKTKVAIVTCGGLCPGLNNVIRSVYVQLHYHYGVPAVLGVRYGFLRILRRSFQPAHVVELGDGKQHSPARRHAAGHFTRAGQRRHHRRFSGAARHQHSVHGWWRRDTTRSPRRGRGNPAAQAQNFR